MRDMILGKKAHDWDLATDAAPDEIIKIFKETKQKVSVIPTGIKHGTVTVLFRGHSIEDRKSVV